VAQFNTFDAGNVHFCPVQMAFYKNHIILLRDAIMARLHVK